MASQCFGNWGCKYTKRQTIAAVAAPSLAQIRELLKGGGVRSATQRFDALLCSILTEKRLQSANFQRDKDVAKWKWWSFIIFTLTTCHS